MTEDLHKDTTSEESGSNEHRHHRHHHSHHEHSHRHHRSSHSSHHKSSGRHHKKTTQNNKFKSFFKKISHKLSLSHGTPHNKIKKLATSTKKSNPDTYTVISRRVLFGAIFLSVVIYCIVFLFSGDDDAGIKNAGYTPSETSTLKKQVMQLELDNARLKEELERYKVLYGELTDEQKSDEDMEKDYSEE